MDELFNHTFNQTFERFNPSPEFTIPTEVTKDEAGYHVHLQLPGITKDQVKVQLEKDQITVTVSDKKETVKSIGITPTIDSPKITCSMDLGILIIDLPFKEEHVIRKRTIEIK
jgi:HSP20 family molecular chaperone IbpA